MIVAGQGGQGASLTDRMRSLNTPAVSIAVINDGRIEWARAYGSLQAGGGAPADTASLFQAASVSKPVAVLGALLLAERGGVSLDADVNTYLRSWRVPENAHTAREKVTLRRIMSHNAGLTVHGFPGYAAGAPIPTTVQVLDGQAPANTGPVRVDTLPGSILRYSGGGMTVMQLMLEDVTGRPFPAFLRETVLLPLGMTHSSYDYDVPTEAQPRIARAHDRQGGPSPGDGTATRRWRPRACGPRCRTWRGSFSPCGARPGGRRAAPSRPRSRGRCSRCRRARTETATGWGWR